MPSNLKKKPTMGEATPPHFKEPPQPSQSEFVAKLEARQERVGVLCVGLDTDFSKIPDSIKRSSGGVKGSMVRFNLETVDATSDFACAFKPNAAFYEAHGTEGWGALYETVRYIKYRYPDILVILDGKRADIGNTNNGYAQAAFDVLGVDAITVHPYLGREAMKPFLDRTDKGIIVLVRTSNPGAGELQDLRVGENQEPLYQTVARHVAAQWNENGNCGVVVGATYPQELVEVRRIVGDMPILIPGVGAQGGDIEATVRAGQNSRGMGMIINSSRGIIFASQGPDFAQAARAETQKLHNQINSFRN